MKLIYLIPGLFIIVLIVWISYAIFFVPTELCNLKDDFKKAGYVGIIKKKYEDHTNHSYKTLIIEINHNDYVMILPVDTSGYYGFVRIGDTVSKIKDSDYIQVNKSKRFKIYFACEDKK
jgi:hypothetical protein